MKNITEFKGLLASRMDIVIDLVRIYLGIALFAKGLYFLSHQEALNKLLEGSENLAFAQAAAAHYVIPAHLVGGLLLALGLLTRLAALSQIPILLGALFYVWLPKVVFVEQRQNFEFTALVLFLLVLVSIYGAGRISVDHLLMRKEHRQVHAQSAA